MDEGFSCSAESFAEPLGDCYAVSPLLLAQLVAALGGMLLELLELLLNVGRKVGYLRRPADFDHFVIRAGDVRGPFERLFARFHLNHAIAADHFLRFGTRAVGNFRLSAFEGDARSSSRAGLDRRARAARRLSVAARCISSWSLCL